MSPNPAATSQGFDPARLSRLDVLLGDYVDDGRLAGLDLAVHRRGREMHRVVLGTADRERGTPVHEDTIWRIYSMTKPMTCAVAMVLWERGRLALTDRVDRYIPEFADTPVYRSGSALSPTTEPQRRPLQVWHLMTHTSGLTYGFMHAHPVDAMYRAAGFEWGIPDGLDLAGVCARLAGIPLVFQPGAEWNYGMSTDVLGRVIEVVEGRPLAEVVQDVLLDPLGMTDTLWWVPADRLDRLAALYVPGADGLVRYDQMGDFAVSRPSATLGGGGLCSTTRDMTRFAEMMRRGGELDGVRILAPGTVARMTANHMPGGADLATVGRPLFAESTFLGVGYGLGVSVTLDPVKGLAAGSVGDHGWGGGASTFYWVDPVLDLTVVFMTQLLPSSTHPLRSQLKQLVHAALVAP